MNVRAIVQREFLFAILVETQEICTSITTKLMTIKHYNLSQNIH